MVARPAGMLGRRRHRAGSGDFLKRLQTINITRCDEAAWRFLGISLAGYNALISLALAAVAALAPLRHRAKA